MSAITGLSGAAAASSASAYETLTSEDFIRVMFAELTRQDPTKPTDSKDLLQQLGTIRSIESDLTLSKRLQEITRQNEIASAGGMVGQFVEGTSDTGVETRGFVDSVSITRLGILLNLSSGMSVPLSRLSKVYDPALIGVVPPATENPPDTTPGTDDASGDESERTVDAASGDPSEADPFTIGAREVL